MALKTTRVCELKSLPSADSDENIRVVYADGDADMVLDEDEENVIYAHETRPIRVVKRPFRHIVIERVKAVRVISFPPALIVKPVDLYTTTPPEAIVNFCHSVVFGSSVFVFGTT